MTAIQALREIKPETLRLTAKAIRLVAFLDSENAENLNLLADVSDYIAELKTQLSDRTFKGQ